MSRRAIFKISDPRELHEIEGFEDAYRDRCSLARINHVRFLGPDDRFSFACQRLNTCCKNFSDSEKILLDPYDVYRLSRNARISTGKFMDKYATLALDNETHIPIAQLNYKGQERKNKCHFLRSYGCAVYQDRPLRCRLYPLGKISSRERSFFILINNCPCGNEKVEEDWSVEEWLSDSGCESYLEFQGITNSLLEDCDLIKFKSLPEVAKIQFGKMMYDLDSFISTLDAEKKPRNDRELADSLADWTTGFLASHGCLKMENVVRAAAI